MTMGQLLAQDEILEPLATIALRVTKLAQLHNTRAR